MSESTSDDKESSGAEKCSDCGREFENLRVHHGMTDCGPDTKRQLVCEYCGDDFEVHASEADRRKCCSRECIDAWKRENRSGEAHPGYVDNETECEYCGGTFQRPPSHKSPHNFCGRECMTQWARENRKAGEKAERWKGGHTNYYGPNWGTQRKKALQRDGDSCQACGVRKSAAGRELHVHHIKRKEWFVENCGEEWWREANQLDNLVTLCDSCHYKWEGIPIRPTLIPND